MTKDEQHPGVRRSLEQDRFSDLYSSSGNPSMTDNRWAMTKILNSNEEGNQHPCKNNTRILASSPDSSILPQRSSGADEDECVTTVSTRPELRSDQTGDSSDNDSTQVFEAGCISARINGCKKRKLYQPQQHESTRTCEEGRRSTTAHHIFGEFGSFQERLTAFQHQSLLSRNQALPDQTEPKHLNRDELNYGRQPLSVNGNMLRPTLNHLGQNGYADAAKRVLLEQQYVKATATKAAELESLAEMLKRELASSLAHLIDDTLSRFTAQQQQHHRNNSKPGEDVTSKQKARIIDRGLRNGDIISFNLPPQLRTPYFSPFLSNPPPATFNPTTIACSAGGLHSLLPATNYTEHQTNNLSPHLAPDSAEQDEAISLVMSPKNSKNNTLENHSPSPSEANTSPLPNQDPTANSPSLSRSSTPPSFYPVSTPTQPSFLGNPNLLSAYFAAAAAAAAVSSARNPESNHLLRPTMLTGPSSAHFRHYDIGDRNADSPDLVAQCFDGFHQIFTLTPMHLRKAKLMFFWVRYPSSTILKAYFPDVKFNKNNTAQLVKWFSNFREFYYIQMEKYSRQLLNEGHTNVDEIRVPVNSELIRVLNMHYNRNNHIEVPAQFVLVVTQTMREFFKAIQARKDCEPSWKKAIYKIIARLDEPVPDFFRSPNFLERFDG